MISAIALPQLMPAIVISRFEGAARHFAGYGRSAISRAILLGEPLTVNIDLDKQEYWTVRLKMEGDQLFKDEKLTKEFSFDDQQPTGKSTKNTKSAKNAKNQNSFMDKLTPANIEGEPPDPSMDPRHQQFERFIRAQLEARANRLEREGILGEIGPLFDKQFSLENEKDQYEELKEPLMERTKLPVESRLESVRVGSTTHTSGLVEIELSSMGLTEPVVAYFKSEDGDYFTVLWDPIMCGAQIERGQKEFDTQHTAKKHDQKERDDLRAKHMSGSKLRDSSRSKDKTAYQKNRESYKKTSKDKSNRDKNSRNSDSRGSKRQRDDAF
jgi:hypothetical protein